MKRYILTLALLASLTFNFQLSTLRAQDTLWVRYDDRFKANYVIPLMGADSIEVRPTQLKIFSPEYAQGYRNLTTTSLIPLDEAEMRFSNPGRYLLKPNTYSGTDYTNANAKSGYNFAHSTESDHYAVFWDVRYGEDPKRIKHPDNGSIANANDVLAIGEKCWDKYLELGFLKEGESTTDKYKIQLYIPYQSEWRADASGTDGVNGGKTGIGHFNPWAATARGGHTVAHEIGHTFQYLTSADQGGANGFNYGYGDNATGDNGWWESCADWQAYKIFPDRQFTDGEYFEQHLANHHLNLLHEDWRYACCYIQDWWCMKHGQDFIGRMWRESKRPEDPVEAYQRMCGLTQEQFNDEQMEGYMRMATWDIDGVRTAAAHRIGSHTSGNYLTRVSGTTDTWQSDATRCIQNYGYHIINMNNATAGTVVKAHFKGIAGADGYNSVYPERAGWRYAFVAMTNGGERVYGEVGRDKEGMAQLTVPANCQRIFFVVMGAPTRHWHHPWDRNHPDPYPQNNEQWPYQVRFEGTNIAGR